MSTELKRNQYVSLVGRAAWKRARFLSDRAPAAFDFSKETIFDSLLSLGTVSTVILSDV